MGEFSFTNNDTANIATMLPPEYKRALDVLLASLTEILRSSRLKFDKYLLYSGEIQIVEGRSSIYGTLFRCVFFYHKIVV